MVISFYYDNPTQFQSHTHLDHGNISMTQVYGTAERHASAINKSSSPSDSIHGNDLQRKLNVLKGFIIIYPKKWYLKSDLMVCHCSKIKVVHQNSQYLCVHMGTAAFVTRFWPWPLLHHGVRRLQLQHVSPLLPYLPIFHFLPSLTEPHL